MNILIVGLGSIANKHINAINTLNINTQIYALRSTPNAEIVNGITNIYDLNNLTIKFDFAIISNPTQLHYKYINELSDRGLDLFIEKPPVSKLDNVHALINKLEGKNIKTYVACNLRFHPCIKYLKEFLSTNHQKRINEVNIYSGSYLPEWRPNRNFREIYSANPEMGGGVHLDLFHELDYAQWLFGKPIQTHCIKRNVSSLHIKSIDSANYILEYEEYNTNIVLNYYRRDTKRTIEIVFDDETWTIDLINNKIKNNLENIVFEVENFSVLDTYPIQMRYFIDSLNTNQKQMNTFAESIEVLKTCLSND